MDNHADDSKNEVEDNGNDNQPQQAPVFHPISLTGGLMEDSDTDDNDDNDHDTNDQKGPTTTLQSTTTMTTTNTTKTMGTIPLYENAMEECFRLAVESHDATSSQAVWHWDKTIDKEETIMLQVDPAIEEEALRSWMPRPLFLPTWAIENDGS